MKRMKTQRSVHLVNYKLRIVNQNQIWEGF